MNRMKMDIGCIVQCTRYEPRMHGEKITEAPEELAPYLRAWERHNVHFGVSCTRHRLQKWTPVFGTASITLTREHAPEDLMTSHETRLTVVVSSECTMYRFPHGYSDATKRGLLNPMFLDAASLLHEHLSPLISSPTSSARMIVFPISHIGETEGVRADKFVEMLARFLDALSCRCAAEVSNPEFLLPAYFDCLRERHVVNVLGDKPPMPSLLDQIMLPHVLTTDTVLVRTEAGMDPEWQSGIVEITRRCVDEKKALYIYMNDDGPHDVLTSLLALMETLNQHLARLSPLKRQAA